MNTNTQVPHRYRKHLLAGVGVAALTLGLTVGITDASAGSFAGENGVLSYTVVKTGDPNANPPVPTTASIFTAEPDGSQQTQLTPSDGRAQESEWSANGKKLVYTKPDPAVRELARIYVRDLASGQETKITDSGYAFSPTWNRDGTKVAYALRENPGDPAAIRWSYSDGSPGGAQLSPNGQNATDPTYSPDGNYIAYSAITSIGQGAPCPGNLESDLWRMDADGSNPTQLTDKDCASRSPSWSPDGTRIAFASTLDAGEHIYALNVGNGQIDPVTSGPNWQGQPTWSPDGKLIAYFDDDLQGPRSNDGIRIVAVDGRGDRATGLAGYDPSWQVKPATTVATRTELNVNAMKGSKKLKVGQKKKLVKSAQTNGEITKVKIVCKTSGDKVKGKKAKKRVCGAKEKKKNDPTTAKVVAKPKCDTKVKIKAVVKAQYQQAEQAKWKRTWKVKKNTGPGCQS